MSAREREKWGKERARLRREAELARLAALGTVAGPTSLEQSIRLLREAHATLQTTDLHYQGHRSQAMANVTSALEQLGGRVPLIATNGRGAAMMDARLPTTSCAGRKRTCSPRKAFLGPSTESLPVLSIWRRPLALNQA